MASEKEKPAAAVHQAPPQIAIVPTAAAPANGADRGGDMNTVREILFGATQRATESAIAALDAKLEAKVDDLTRLISDRFNELSALIADVQKNAESAQATAIDEIGVAISQLSSTIRNVSVVRKPK